MGGFTYQKFALLAIPLLITLQNPFVSAFSTTKCDHNQIEKHLKATLNCVMNSQNKNMGEFLELNATQIAGKLSTGKDKQTNTSEWCELIDEEISCFTDNLGTCFDEKITSDFATLMEWYYNKQPYMECNRIEGLSKDEIERKAIAIIGNYKQDVENLKKIVKFDQDCSTDQLVSSVKGRWPCIMKHFWLIMQELIPHIIGPSPTEPTSLPVCENVVGILNNCFQKTNCLSQQEMNLIRDFLATYYNVAMSFIVQLSSKFGSLSNFMEAAGVGIHDMHNVQGIPKLDEKMKTMMMTAMDLVVDDYQTDTCHTSLQQFPMMIDDTLMHSLPFKDGDGPEAYVVIIAMVLSLVVIMLVAMLGWVFYAYRNPTTRSGQILIRSTAKNRLFRSASTSTV